MTQDMTKKRMEDLATTVMFLAQNGWYDTCNTLLREFGDTNHSYVMSEFLLRATLAYKSKLPAWDSLFAQAKRQLDGFGVNSGSVLEDLLPL
jgi:hypothetical protein